MGDLRCPGGYHCLPSGVRVGLLTAPGACAEVLERHVTGAATVAVTGSAAATGTGAAAETATSHPPRRPRRANAVPLRCLVQTGGRVSESKNLVMARNENRVQYERTVRRLDPICAFRDEILRLGPRRDLARDNGQGRSVVGSCTFSGQPCGFGYSGDRRGRHGDPAERLGPAVRRRGRMARVTRIPSVSGGPA
jgi:hypothetical protein